MSPNRNWQTLSPSEQAACRAQAVDAYRRAGSFCAASRLLRQEGAPYVHKDFVRRSVEMAESGGAETPAPQAREIPNGAPDFARSEDGDKARIDYTTSQRIRTLEDAMAYAEVDETVWRCKKWSCTAWEVGMKLRQFDDKGKVANEAPHREQLWRVSIELERILPKAWQDATEAIIRRMEQYSPAYPKMKVRQQPNDPHLLEVDLFDCHFGKLAWKPETGTDYDLKIAERVYKNAMTDLLNRAAGFEVDRIILPIGNDFFHVDNFSNQTTAGTPQDVDGRLEKIIEVGTMAIIWAVETLMAIAPVEVLRVPGNHDRQTSLHLAREIRAWFRQADQVKVDISPGDRKYRRYGENLIGFTHGNEEKHVDLPVIMATEAPDDWALSKHREVHVGHWHRAKELRIMPLETYGGVGVRFLMALSGYDAWHARRGFVGSRRAAECFLWGKAPGLAGHFTASIRDE